MNEILQVVGYSTAAWIILCTYWFFKIRATRRVYGLKTPFTFRLLAGPGAFFGFLNRFDSANRGITY